MPLGLTTVGGRRISQDDLSISHPKEAQTPDEDEYSYDEDEKHPVDNHQTPPALDRPTSSVTMSADSVPTTLKKETSLRKLTKRASIAATSLVKPSKFLIDVTVLQNDGTSSAWSVKRSENDFITLHRKLRSRMSGVLIPDYPLTQISKKLGMMSHKAKARKLQSFLDGLCEIPEVLNSDTMCSFLIGSFRDITQKMIMPSKMALEEAKLEKDQFKSMLKEKEEEIRALREELIALKVSEAKKPDFNPEKVFSNSIAMRSSFSTGVTGKQPMVDAGLLQSLNELSQKLERAEAKTKEKSLEVDMLQRTCAEMKSHIESLTSKNKMLKQEKKVLLKEVKKTRLSLENVHESHSNAGSLESVPGTSLVLGHDESSESQPPSLHGGFSMQSSRDSVKTPHPQVFAQANTPPSPGFEESPEVLEYLDQEDEN
eukprot:TRINITY_DN224_c0_g1_i2.p1 TRINITY_DN224_c0_g1~~TRINITY_DN224_c0_g1_i2.p1  ORF type:complete len:428 (-),score=125.97 TRINITY_DN224_c0_g1_i2:131-1414(-)